MTSKALALRRFSRSPRGLISRPRRLFVSVSSFFPRLRVGVDRRTTFSILEQHRVLSRYENGGKRRVVFCETFFRFVVKSRMCCLSFITSRSIYYARSLSLSLLLVVIIAQRRLTRFFSLSLSFKVLFLFRFSFVYRYKNERLF
jgi:hypothetical protein